MAVNAVNPQDDEEAQQETPRQQDQGEQDKDIQEEKAQAKGQ